VDQPGIPEHSEVFGYGRLRKGNLSEHICAAAFGLLGEKAQDIQAGRVRQGAGDSALCEMVIHSGSE
jgi:hypothetical protein